MSNKKILFFLLLIIPSFLMAENGMYIVGSISIFSDATLSTELNVQLVNANIQGNGTFILSGKSSQKIFSKNSAIENLEINNLSEVILDGDLTIQNTLHIENGIFNVTSAYSFIVQENAQITTGPSGKLIGYQKEKLAQTLPILINTNNSTQNIIPKFISSSNLSNLKFVSKIENSYYTLNKFNSIHIESIKPPPKYLRISNTFQSKINKIITV